MSVHICTKFTYALVFAFLWWLQRPRQDACFWSQREIDPDGDQTSEFQWNWVSWQTVSFKFEYIERNWFRQWHDWGGITISIAIWHYLIQLPFWITILKSDVGVCGVIVKCETGGVVMGPDGSWWVLMVSNYRLDTCTRGASQNWCIQSWWLQTMNLVRKTEA